MVSFRFMTIRRAACLVRALCRPGGCAGTSWVAAAGTAPARKGECWQNPLANSTGVCCAFKSPATGATTQLRRRQDCSARRRPKSQKPNKTRESYKFSLKARKSSLVHGKVVRKGFIAVEFPAPKLLIAGLLDLQEDIICALGARQCRQFRRRAIRTLSLGVRMSSASSTSLA